MKTSTQREHKPFIHRASQAQRIGKFGSASERSAIRRIIGNLGIQPKLTIGQPNDKYEQEADQVADKVMRMSDADVAQRVESGTAQPMQVQRKCPACKEELQRQPEEDEAEGMVQAKEVAGQVPHVDSGVEARINSLKSGGMPLDQATRRFFEPRFGRNFAGVRIHTSSLATRTARGIQARAFTLGKDIVFNQGEYQPSSESGRRLLGHELTHVVQQGGVDKGRIHRLALADTATQEDAVPTQPVGESTAETGNRPGCTPAAGITSSHCSAYLRNAWWLPWAYVNNATCACRTTPNSPTANCVRSFLQARLAATPTWLKLAAAAQKPNDIPGSPMNRAYQIFVQSVLTPLIYRDHVDAYRNCCCPCGPAPYGAWVGVSSVPIQPCSMVDLSIRFFGSCHCTPGRW